jgi:hypothetical protein
MDVDNTLYKKCKASGGSNTARAFLPGRKHLDAPPKRCPRTVAAANRFAETHQRTVIRQIGGAE